MPNRVGGRVSLGEKFHCAKTIIRTGDDSRAELTLDDGSVIQLLEIVQKFFYYIILFMIYVMANGDRKLQVILGNILGKNQN